MNQTFITVQTSMEAPIEKIWEYWTNPKHIVNWNTASDDWHTTKAENDLTVGGHFLSRMEAKDGSMGFDFVGKYDAIKTHELIAYTIVDNRKVTVQFQTEGGKTLITETFEAETENPIAMQQEGWQMILNNFKKYVTAN